MPPVPPKCTPGVLNLNHVRICVQALCVHVCNNTIQGNYWCSKSYSPLLFPIRSSLPSSLPSPPLSPSPPLPPPPVQVLEHFQDCDPLHSGSISCSHFRQGLTFIGQSSFTHSEFTALCEAFRYPRKKDHVLWKEFLARVDRGVCGWVGGWVRKVCCTCTCMYLWACLSYIP